MDQIFEPEQSNEVDEPLNDLPVASDQADDTKGGDTFSVNFQKISFTYKPQKPDGSLE